jgi:hypothetical protein
MTNTTLEAADYGRGLAPIGATFEHPTLGTCTIAGYSITAYEIADLGDGLHRYVSFDQVHGKPQPAEGLTTFADGSRYSPATREAAGRLAKARRAERDADAALWEAQTKTRETAAIKAAFGTWREAMLELTAAEDAALEALEAARKAGA